MTKNRRYETHYDCLNDGRIADADAPPCTLPASAYGPQPLQWVPKGAAKPAVWAWVSWPDRVAERIAAFASGWNDRVVIVEWTGPTGRRDAVVWRNAVTRRRDDTTTPSAASVTTRVSSPRPTSPVARHDASARASGR